MYHVFHVFRVSCVSYFRVSVSTFSGLWAFRLCFLSLWSVFLVLGFWGFGVLGFWGFGVLGFWGFGVLGFWGFGVLGFGISPWGFVGNIFFSKTIFRKGIFKF